MRTDVPAGRAASALVLLILLTLAGGCRLDLGVDVVLDHDGGGALTVSVRADAELERAAEQAGVDPLGRLTERVRSLDDGWRVRDVVDEADGSRVVELTSNFADPDAFAERYGALAAALDAPEARLLGPLAVSVDEEADRIAVEGELAVLVTDIAAEDVGMDVATLTSQLQDVLTASLAVHTPGTPLSTDGTVDFDDPEAMDGPAVVQWTASPGTTVPVSLLTERGGPDLLRLLLPIVALLLAIGLIGGGIWAQRRR